ncbi:hypothetical protein CNMCM8686_008838 [Aspergillus fumigatus]|nr:hypothetical protein CNMCM8686_008838 [Aspergillus fumigatus]
MMRRRTSARPAGPSSNNGRTHGRMCFWRPMPDGHNSASRSTRAGRRTAKSSASHAPSEMPKHAARATPSPSSTASSQVACASLASGSRAGALGPASPIRSIA